MPTEPKPLAKSLHTVSVLINLSRWLLDHIPSIKNEESAMVLALHILYLDEKPDVYGLVDQALKQLMD